MEQKTEASQAVDEQVLPHLPRAVGYRHTMDNTEGLKGNKPVVVFCATKPNPFGIPGLDYSASFPVTTETLFTADQMRAYARAALKAQPAPTEAQGSKLLELFKHTLGSLAVLDFAEAERISMLYRADGTFIDEATKTVAQGEDSARLDFFAPLVLNPLCGCAKCNPSAVGRMMILCAICGNKRCPHAADHGFVCTSSNEPGQVGVPYEIDRARASAETGGVKP